jgi:hydroxyacylglutathione hydrolase
LANAEFALSIYPSNENIRNRYEHIQKAVSEKKNCLPTTLELELKTNPFLIYDDAILKDKLGKMKSTDLEVFSEIRSQKDNF